MPELEIGSPIIAGRPEVPRNKLGMAFRKGDKAMVDAVNAALAAAGEKRRIRQDPGQMASAGNGDIRKPV